MKRDELELLALMECPAEIYYDLLDCIEQASDMALAILIRRASNEPS